MKKNKAIAIFCVLFIILLVLVVSTSNYLSKNNIDKDNILAAVVEGSGGGTGTSTDFYATNTHDLIFSNKDENSISCDTSHKNYKNALISKALVTIKNKDNTLTVARGCIYGSSLKVGSTLPATCSDGVSVARQLPGGIYGSNISYKIYVCPDINKNSDSEGTSGGSAGSNASGGNSQSGGSQTNENSSIQGTGKESGTVASGICDQPRLEYDNLCTSEGFLTASKIAGIIILVAKWLAPLILIILGMIDFGKAFLSGDDKSLTDATSTFIKRMIIAIIIPIIPGLLYYLVDFFVGDRIKDENGEYIKDASGNFQSCTTCLRNPLNCNVKLYDYSNCKE